MAHDPLAPFRKEPGLVYEQAQVSDEHRVLRVAIEALNQIPNTPLSGEYKNTYALIPVLETVYRNAERELSQQQGYAPMTDAQIDGAVEHDLKLWEGARKDSIDIEPER